MASRQTKSSPICRLSQELVDEVINNLFYTTENWPPGQRRRNMSICALVCKSFLPRAQRHLFAHITLPGSKKNLDDYTRITSLKKIMNRRSEIATYVDEISLAIHQGDSWMYTPAMRQIMLDIIASPSSLKSLKLKGGPGGYIVQNPSDFLTRFFRPYIAPHITSLHLEALLEAPPQLVLSCVNLKQLSLLFSPFRNADEDHVPIDCPKIERLEYLGSVFGIRRMCSGLQLALSSLRHLTVHTDFLEDLTGVQEIINTSDGALEEVMIEIYDPEQATILSSAALDLRNQPRLRTLFQLAFIERTDSNTLVDTCTTIQTIPTINNVTKLGIHFRVGAKDTIRLRTLKEVVLKAEWEVLGSEIIRITAGGRPLELALMMEYRFNWNREKNECLSGYRDFRDGAYVVVDEILRVITEERLCIPKTLCTILQTSYVTE